MELSTFRQVNDVLPGAAQDLRRFRCVDDSVGGKVSEISRRQRNTFANSIEHRIRNGHVHIPRNAVSARLHLHMLIRSCVFHYELELIHPFADGNGRVGRLWHTLLLSKWNPVFAWLPVESIIHDHQQEYYDAINASNDAGESTAFIEFMLSVIKASLIDAIHTSDAMSAGKMDKKTLRWQKIEQFLQTHEYIMNADVRELCGVSAATANRILAGLANEGKLYKARANGHWVYQSSN